MFYLIDLSFFHTFGRLLDRTAVPDCLFLFISCELSNTQAAVASYSSVMFLKPFERLPKTIRPVHYEISIQPDLGRLVFQGKETVTFQVFTFKGEYVTY